MLSGLLWKLGKPLGLHAAAKFVRDVAEAKPGTDPRLTRLYWALAGKKLWIGLVLKLTSAVLFGLGEVNAAIAVVSLGAFCLTAGVVDRAWRTEIPESVVNSAVYRFLANFKAEITTALAGATVYFYSADCTGPDCAMWAKIMVGLTVLAFEFGLVDAAAKSPVPLSPEAAEKFRLLAAAEAKVTMENAAAKIDAPRSGPDGDSLR